MVSEFRDLNMIKTDSFVPELSLVGCLGNFVLQIVVLLLKSSHLFPKKNLQLFPFLKLYFCLKLLCNMRERARDACIRQWLNTPVTKALFGGL